MANVFDDGSGNRSASATLGGGSSEEDGHQFTGLSKVSDRVMFFDYDFGGNAGSFAVQFRYHNGVAWGPWHYCYYRNSSDERTKTYNSSAGDTGKAQINLSSQDFYVADGMKGFQFRIKRESGSDDITLTNGVVV